MIEACERCDEVHPGCVAHNRAGGPCGCPPCKGQRVCRMHGGRSPQAVAAAEKRLEREAVGAELERLGVAVDVDPGEALVGLVREAAGNVAFLRAKVQELKQEAQAISVVTDDDGVRMVSAPKAIAGPTGSIAKPYEAAPHIYVAMYAEWCDRLANYASLALRAGVDERRIRLAERDAEALMGAVVTALDAAGLEPEQQEAFRVALADRLRQLDP